MTVGFSNPVIYLIWLISKPIAMISYKASAVYRPNLSGLELS